MHTHALTYLLTLHADLYILRLRHFYMHYTLSAHYTINYKCAHTMTMSTIELSENHIQIVSIYSTLTLNVLMVKLRHLTESKTHKHKHFYKVAICVSLCLSMRCDHFLPLYLFEFCNYTIAYDVFVCVLCGLRFHFVSFRVAFYLVFYLLHLCLIG